MCQHTFNGLQMVRPLMSPAPSELAPLPETYILNHLYGLQYNGGFKMFSQLGGYYPEAFQTYTPEGLGLVSGQIFGQPLTMGSQ